MSNNKDKHKKSPPSFSGNVMPTNIKKNMSDGEPEPTRRLAAGVNIAVRPAAVQEPSREASLESTLQQKGPVGEGPTVRFPEPKIDPKPVPKPSVWKWKLDDVPTLPEFHPLERTAVFVPNVPPSTVSGRISNILRERSIEASYDDEKAKVKCLTADGVDFRVRLYRGRAKYDHGIIVEVQRRFGASTTFHYDTMAILDSAEGKIPAPPPPLGSNLPIVSDSEDDFEPIGSSSLMMVSKIMEHNGYDSHYLALQTLSSMTDASKMGDATAHSISKQLFSLGAENQVGSKVLSLILDKKQDDMFKLRDMAMTVLANAVQAVKGSVPDMVREQLRPVLIEELRAADKTPRCAFQAARCVEWFLPLDHDLSDLHGALEIALEAGTARHAALMRQAQLCLDRCDKIQ